MKLASLLAAFAIALPSVASAQTAYEGEVTFTKTNEVGVYRVKGVLSDPTGPVHVDANATFANDVMTYTVQEKLKSIVAALGQKGAETVTLTFEVPVGSGPEGTWTVTTPAGGVPTYTRVVAPGEDPNVALAETIPLARSEAERATVATRFGVKPRRWFGYLTPAATGREVSSAVSAASRATGVPPAWLYTAAIGEGLNLYLEGGLPSAQPAFSLEGFSFLGTDTFSTRAASLKKEGFLPKSFTLGRDYVSNANTNEHGDKVSSANFKDLTTGLTALGAMLAESRAKVTADAKKIWGPDVKLTEDDIRFWSYFDFNVGSGARRAFMKKHDLAWGRSRPAPERSDNREGRYNALVRVSTARWLEDLGFFAGKPAKPVTAAVANRPLGE